MKKIFILFVSLFLVGGCISSGTNTAPPPDIEAINRIVDEVLRLREELKDDDEEDPVVVTPEPPPIPETPPTVPETPIVSEDGLVDGFDVSKLRKHRIHPANLRSAPVNIIWTNKKSKSLGWKLPDGFKSGDHGFFEVRFDADKNILAGSEKFWSRNGTDSRQDTKYPNTKYAMIAWTNMEGRGDDVYGRSQIVPVK